MREHSSKVHNPWVQRPRVLKREEKGRKLLWVLADFIIGFLLSSMWLQQECSVSSSVKVSWNPVMQCRNRYVFSLYSGGRGFCSCVTCMKSNWFPSAYPSVFLMVLPHVFVPGLQNCSFITIGCVLRDICCLSGQKGTPILQTAKGSPHVQK